MSGVKLNSLFKHRHFANIKYNESLRNHSSWKIGGSAKVLIEPADLSEIVETVKLVNENNIPFIVIGRGTNLLFDDNGFDGVVLKLSDMFSSHSVDGDIIHTDSGCWTPCLARFAMNHGLSGLEHIVGIPGAIGGLVAMNGGSKRKNIGDNILEVKTIGKLTGEIKTYSRQECVFGYRSSRFIESDEIIVKVKIQCEKNNPSDIRHSMLQILRERRNKFPMKQPSCGSVFKNDPMIYNRFGPPGKIIEDSGLKGKQVGNMQVSPKHSNFIVGLGKGSSEDVKKLVAFMIERIFSEIGIELETEVKYVTKNGDIIALSKAISL